MNDAEIRLQVSFDSSKAEKSVKSLSQKADDLSKKFTSFGTKMTLGVTAPLTALATAGVKYNATMETYLANLTTLLGGNEQEANKLLNTLKEMAATTPYETTDLVKATQKMMAFGISANDSLGYLQMIGDIAMGDANKMDSLTLAFSQMGASGRASMEDINQMIDQGFNPLTIVAQKTGESMADLRERVSDGGVSFQEIADAMKTATSEGGIYFGSMDKASKTTAGKFSTLKDDFNSALGEMTESLLPFAESAIEKFSALAKWFSGLDENGKKMVLTLAGIAAAIGPISLAIGTLIKTGLMISQLVTLIKSWQIATNLMSIAQGALNAVMALSPITWIILGIVAIIAALVLLWNNCEAFREAVINIFNAVIDLFKAVIDFFVNNWQGILLFMVNPFAGAFKLLYDNFEGFRNFIDGIVNNIKGFFTSLAEGVKTAFQGVKDFIVLIFSSIADIIKAPINGVIDLINGALKGMNKIKVPDWVPGVGGKGINFSMIPKLNVGTNYVAREGLAYLHQGEAVVPKKYNPALGGTNGATYVTVVADMDVNKFGKAFVKEVKTFSGGAKNSYNYGGAR